MITNHAEYYDETFTDLCHDEICLEAVVFENCTFVDCSFKHAIFRKCRFVDCQFKSCNLSLFEPCGSSFNDTVFKDSKITGVNWTKAYWPVVSLCSPIAFYACDISLSSFYELNLAEIIIQACKAHDTDFRSCDLSISNLTNTDLDKSQFNKTNFSAADLSGAINYYINPTENNIKNANFSLPDVLNLLVPFGIKIEDGHHV